MNHDLEINDLRNRLPLFSFWVFLNRLVRFSIVGLMGVFVDLGGFYVLHNWLDWMLTPSVLLSTELAIINNFFWNDVWTFGDVSFKQPLVTQRLQRFLRFNLICSLGLIFNILFVNLLFYKFGVNEYMAKMAAIILITFWNFGANLKINWQVNKTGD